MNKLLLKNGKIIMEDKTLTGDVLIEDGIIAKIDDEIDNPNAETLDLNGGYVVPGFIDVHIHGSDGCDAMDNSVSSLEKISSFIVKHGVTNFLPTTLTSTKEKLLDVLGKIAQVQDKPIAGANIFGAHMEGPFFDTKYKGAQNEKYLAPANISDIKEYLGVKKNLVKLFSLSPKDDNALEAIKFLSDSGVIVSVGHSACDYDQVIRGIEAGITHSTHTYNGMTGFTHREPGVVGAIFDDSRVKAEVIFDKIHVHPVAVRTLIKCKGVDNVICITDAMSAAGLPDGDYKLGELDVYVKDNSARLKMNDALAGSVLTLDKAFKNIIQLGYSICDAVKMTSTNAAKEFGLNCGEIKVRKQGDLAILDENYNVKMTIVKGKIKYTA